MEVIEWGWGNWEKGMRVRGKGPVRGLEERRRKKKEEWRCQRKDGYVTETSTLGPWHINSPVQILRKPYRNFVKSQQLNKHYKAPRSEVRESVTSDIILSASHQYRHRLLFGACNTVPLSGREFPASVLCTSGDKACGALI